MTMSSQAPLHLYTAGTPNGKRVGCFDVIRLETATNFESIAVYLARRTQGRVPWVRLFVRED